jgi:hypothetical protein
MSKKENFSFVRKFSKSAIWNVSIAFEKIEMMKNRSQFMFCVKVSQTTVKLVIQHHTDMNVDISDNDWLIKKERSI